MEEKAIVDYTLVPTGLVVMVGYHIWLIYQISNRPSRTVIGINSINRRFWVRAMMEDTSKNGVLAVQTLRNNIMASTLLASTAIMLSSLIAVLMSNGTPSAGKIVYGDRSELAFSVKYFSILVCFLVAFLFNVQSIRYYSHASILINVPFKKMALHGFQNQQKKGGDSIVEYVARTVNRGSYFWSLGLRLITSISTATWYLILSLLLGVSIAGTTEDVCAGKTASEWCPVRCFRTDPVCGVDGVTYWCGCGEAMCAGAEVAKTGFCHVGSRSFSAQALLLMHIVWLVFLGFSVVFGLL